MTTSGPSAAARLLTDTEWLGELGCWVVSARLDGDWTLVGLFDASDDAFAAARAAASRLAPGGLAAPQDD